MAVTTTTAFHDMKNIRFEIKQTLHGVRLQIKKLQDLQDHLNAAQSALGKYSDDAEKFKNYTSKKYVTLLFLFYSLFHYYCRTMPVISLVDAPYHSTICSNCNSVCHDNCGLQEITAKGSNAFINCYALSNR